MWLTIAVSMGSNHASYWDSFCLSHPDVEFTINMYTGSHVWWCDRITSLSSYRGTKALFWKLALGAVQTPYLWLLDEDLRTYHDSLYDIARLCRRLSISILQPTIIPLNHAKFTSDESNPCVVHTTSFVEIQAPFFTTMAWSSFHRSVLSFIADDVLFRSDWVDALWCSYVEKRLNSTCAVAKHVVLHHLNTRTLHKNGSFKVLLRRLPRPLEGYKRYPSRTESRRSCLL